MASKTLPKGWRLLPLGDPEVCVEMHFGFACGQKDIIGGVPHLRMNNITANGQTDFTLVRRIPSGVAEKAAKWLEPGDVLFCNTNSTELVGKSCLFAGWKERCTFSNHLTRLRANPKRVMPGWLVLAIRQLWLSGYFATHCREFVGQSAFTQDRLRQVGVPLPPREEQQRIIAGVQALTSRLDEARRLHREACQEVDSICAAATAQHLDDRGKEWPRVELGEVLSLVQYGTSAKATATPKGLPVIRMGNIQQGRVLSANLKYLDLPPAEVAKYRMLKGDILINRTNSADLVGKSGLFDLDGEYLFASYLIRLRVEPRVADPAYVNYAINSGPGQAYLKSQGKDAIGQTNINTKQIRRMPLPLPSLDIQRRIVAHLDALREKSDRLRRLQAEADAELASFTPALLAKAFRGEL